jgi:hypothetical protein
MGAPILYKSCYKAEFGNRKNDESELHDSPLSVPVVVWQCNVSIKPTLEPRCLLVSVGT